VVSCNAGVRRTGGPAVAPVARWPATPARMSACGHSVPAARGEGVELEGGRSRCRAPRRALPSPAEGLTASAEWSPEGLKASADWPPEGLKASADWSPAENSRDDDAYGGGRPVGASLSPFAWIAPRSSGWRRFSPLAHAAGACIPRRTCGARLDPLDAR
jgi:hypothetical protein